MYDYHTFMETRSPLAILPRAAAVAVERAARVAPVVVLLGARQTGKTTLVRSLPLLADRPYLTLDDFDLRMQAEADPESVVARAPALVLDEVQRALDLLIAIKRAVDRDPARTPGRFVLTGSANLLMLERIGETLAGRAVYVTLWPFARRERFGLGRAGAWSELLAAPFAGEAQGALLVGLPRVVTMPVLMYSLINSQLVVQYGAIISFVLWMPSLLLLLVAQRLLRGGYLTAGFGV